MDLLSLVAITALCSKHSPAIWGVLWWVQRIHKTSIVGHLVGMFIAFHFHMGKRFDQLSVLNIGIQKVTCSRHVKLGLTAAPNPSPSSAPFRTC